MLSELNSPRQVKAHPTKVGYVLLSILEMWPNVAATVVGLSHLLVCVDALMISHRCTVQHETGILSPYLSAKVREGTPNTSAYFSSSFR